MKCLKSVVFVLCVVIVSSVFAQSSNQSLNFWSPPVANAGPDQTVEATSSRGAVVQLDGSGSYDPEGHLRLRYYWLLDNGSFLKGMKPRVLMPLGRMRVRLLVINSRGLWDMDEVIICVQDTTPPIINMELIDGIPSSPNDCMVFAGRIFATDRVDKTLRLEVCVWPSSYYFNKQTGELYVYAGLKNNERGRIYYITAEAKDFAGNTSVKKGRVVVESSYSYEIAGNEIGYSFRK